MKQLPLRSHSYRQLLRDFTQWIATLGYAESSVYSLPIFLQEFFHFLERQGITRWQKATTEHVQQFVRYLGTRPNERRGGGISDSHINKYIQALKLLSKFLQLTDQGYLSVDIKPRRVTRRIEGLLSQAEVQALYECCDITTAVGIRDRVMLSLYYGCGLRRSEGVGLDTGDVLTRRKMLYVRKGKNYRERYVPINASIIADLQAYLHEARPQLLGKRYTAALLVSERGRRIQSLSLSLRLKVLLQRAGVDKPTTLHTLRHSIATHLLQSGMPLQDIARFLGHQSLEATQIYTHLDHEATTGL